MRLFRKRGIFLFLVSIAFLCVNLSAQAQDAAYLNKEIYSKLRDRRCTDMTLDKCNCPDAREMKAYIEALIDTGMSKGDIFYKVAKKFSLNTILDEQIKAQVQEKLIKEAGEDRPQIMLEAASFDFGQVSKKQGKIKKTFKLYNKGTGKLIIANIKVSCSCVSASLAVHKNKSPDFGTQGAPSGWQAIIEPGESGELEVAVDLNHPSISIGKLTREIHITTNDPLYPEVTVRIDAEVQD